MSAKPQYMKGWMDDKQMLPTPLPGTGGQEKNSGKRNLGSIKCLSGIACLSLLAATNHSDAEAPKGKLKPSGLSRGDVGSLEC